MIRVVINRYSKPGVAKVYEYLKGCGEDILHIPWTVVPSVRTCIVKGNLFSTAQCMKSVRWMQGPEVYASAL